MLVKCYTLPESLLNFIIFFPTISPVSQHHFEFQSCTSTSWGLLSPADLISTLSIPSSGSLMKVLNSSKMKADACWILPSTFLCFDYEPLKNNSWVQLSNCLCTYCVVVSSSPDFFCLFGEITFKFVSEVLSNSKYVTSFCSIKKPFYRRRKKGWFDVLSSWLAISHCYFLGAYKDFPRFCSSFSLHKSQSPAISYHFIYSLTKAVLALQKMTGVLKLCCNTHYLHANDT